MNCMASKLKRRTDRRLHGKSVTVNLLALPDQVEQLVILHFKPQT